MVFRVKRIFNWNDRLKALCPQQIRGSGNPFALVGGEKWSSKVDFYAHKTVFLLILVDD